MRSANTSLPAASGAFEWTDEPWGAALRCRPLGAIAPHLFSTRLTDLSPERLRSLAASVGADDVAMARQVHGRAVIVVRDGATGAGGSAFDFAQARKDPPLRSPDSKADVLVSDARRTAVAVRVADCVPLLMADQARGVVAAVHAGWRGTAARAAVAGVEALGREFGTRPADLVAAIGPSIGACCYDVGTELVDAFAAAGHERYLIDRWFQSPPPPRGSEARAGLRLDIAGANRDQLVLAGVPEDQIHLSGLCTAMHLDVLTSYRAEKQEAARQLGIIRARR